MHFFEAKVGKNVHWTQKPTNSSATPTSSEDPNLPGETTVKAIMKPVSNGTGLGISQDGVWEMVTMNGCYLDCAGIARAAFHLRKNCFFSSSLDEGNCASAFGAP